MPAKTRPFDDGEADAQSRPQRAPVIRDDRRGLKALPGLACLRFLELDKAESEEQRADRRERAIDRPPRSDGEHRGAEARRDDRRDYTPDATARTPATVKSLLDVWP